MLGFIARASIKDVAALGAHGDAAVARGPAPKRKVQGFWGKVTWEGGTNSLVWPWDPPFRIAGPLSIREYRTMPNKSEGNRSVSNSLQV